MYKYMYWYIWKCDSMQYSGRKVTSCGHHTLNPKLYVLHHNTWSHSACTISRGVTLSYTSICMYHFVKQGLRIVQSSSAVCIIHPPCGVVHHMKWVKMMWCTNYDFIWYATQCYSMGCGACNVIPCGVMHAAWFRVCGAGNVTPRGMLRAICLHLVWCTQYESMWFRAHSVISCGVKHALWLHVVWWTQCDDMWCDARSLTPCAMLHSLRFRVIYCTQCDFMWYGERSVFPCGVVHAACVHSTCSNSFTWLAETKLYLNWIKKAVQ